MPKTEPTACRICGVELTSANKRRSHILNDASYFGQLTLKSGEHLMALRKGQPIIKDMGHYTTERILCADCELRIGKWEDERERLLSSDIRSSEEFNNHPYMETVGYNQDSIKLACLADLFRCSVAQGKPYETVSLGEKHESAIRSMLLDGNAGSKYDYPVVLFRFNDKYKTIDGVGGPPISGRGPDGRRIYKTIMPRGWIWVVKVDSQGCEFLEDASIGSFNNTIKIINYGDARKSKELWSIYETVIDTDKI